jgi:predicted transcriptional regulator
MVKVTFTFDEDTIVALKRTASRLNKPQSAIVREAIRDYASRADRLTVDEQEHMLRVVDRVLARRSKRTADEVDAELLDIRHARRSGGRRTPAK